MDYKNIIIEETASIRQALQLLDTSAKRVLFIERDKKLLGAVSDGDIRRWILKSGNLDEPVSTIMNRDPITLSSPDKRQAFDQMKKLGISAIPVVNDFNEIKTIFFWVEEDHGAIIKPIDLKVVIMAGGRGERLLPYTSIVPKPLMPIGDKAIIELIIESFKKYGCKEFTLTINYKKNMIKAYFDELERDYRITYIEEEKPLGTGGSLSLLKDKLTKTFIVSNCDILLDVDYSEIYRYHQHNNNMITIITSLKHYILPYGTININTDGTVCSLIEKPGRDYLINTGVYILEPDALKYLKDAEFMHITELIENCIRDGKKVGTYPIGDEAWMDMGQFDEMEKMKNRFMQE